MAQDQTPNIPDQATIRSTLEAAESIGTPAEALLRDALAQAEAADAFRTQAATSRREINEAPGLLESIRAELDQPARDIQPAPPESATLAQYEQELTQANARLEAARTLVAELQIEASRRQDRRALIPDLLAQTRQRLDAVDDALAAPLSQTEPAIVRDARRTQLLAQRGATLAEIEALEMELSSYDARRDLLPARRDRAARRVANAEREVEAWRTLVSDRRRVETEQAAREAERQRRQVARQHPVLKEFAEETQRLAQQRTEQTGVPRRIDNTRRRASEHRAALADMRKQYTSVRKRIENTGLNRATGLLLRRQFETLPSETSLRREVSATQRELESMEFTLFDRQERRVEAGDIDGVVRELMGDIDAGADARPDLEQASRELAVARRDLLGDLTTDASTYLEALYELDTSSRRLLEATTAYAGYIRERTLWVRSVAGNRFPSPEDLSESVAWFASPTQWQETWTRVRDDNRVRFARTLITFAVVVALFAVAGWGRKRIKPLAEKVGRYKTDAMSHTLATLALTAFVAAPFPALLWWLGGVITRPPQQTLLGLSVGTGLQTAGALLYPLLFMTVALRRDGLCDAHFRWNQRALVTIRANLRWFAPLGVIGLGLAAAVVVRGDDSAIGGLGRLGFTLAMVALIVFILRVFRRHGAVMSELLRINSGGWFERLQRLWMPLLVAVPITLIVLTWLGYFYSALQLDMRLRGTFLLVLSLVLANALLLRWLFIARRRVAIEEAKRRREKAAAEAVQEEEPASESGVQPLDVDRLDLPAISQQTRQLFRTAIFVSAITGLYLIWAGVLPALRMLDRVELYPELRVAESSASEVIPILEPTAAVISNPATEPVTSSTNAVNNGSTTDTPAITPIPALPSPGTSDAAEDDAIITTVTLADLGLAIIIFIATVIAFRNLPGLIEIVVLQRLPLDNSSRYALSTVLRYLIAIVGVILAFNAVDLSWKNIQWLAAALTFGLAFGLQEIFANFVSGLIILGERPIRIGDTISVNGVIGDVTRIKMRATTVTDWDRKELVIPNKNFITSDIINWTLSDPVLRVTIPVGVGYGEDIRKAEAVLLKVASEQPVILKDPKPFVVFNGFGDSTLDFQLRVFIPHVRQLIPTRHDLHMRIAEAFRAADIEIAFPQRDLHIRSIGDFAGLVEKRENLRPGD